MKTNIESVNFHLWEPCNMRCKFCFATFQDVKKTILPKGHLPKEESIQVVKELAQFGFEKITFVGGEPTLCPWLSELILTAKQAEMTTMIVTNGSNLSDEFLEKNVGLLDWITISIDSLNEQTNLKIGRAIVGRKAILIDDYKVLIDRIKKFNYRLKINTVVCSENVSEDLTPIIEYSKPERWKIFQVLPIKGQNDFEFEKFQISQERFKKFIVRHNHLSSLTKIVPESNDEMTGSYAMVDPAGRFFDNTNHEHYYSDSILKIGVNEAYSQVCISEEKFINRGGIYNWSKNAPKRITISGEVASGKSTIGKLLASKLNYEFESIGNDSRIKAESLGKTIVEFQELNQKDFTKFKELDKEFASKCNSKEKIVIDYRIGFRFIKDSFNIFLKIDEETATQRLIYNQRLNESHLTVSHRNSIFKNQFLNSYGVDFTDVSNYDLVIPVIEYESAEEVVELILKQLNKHTSYEI